MADKVHSELSPSNADRWWNCPGSVAACRGLKDTESIFASEGTAAHEVLEKCLKNFDLTPYDMIGMEFQEVEVTEEMAEAVAVAVDFVKAELQKGGTLLVEKKITVVEKEVFGTLDIAIVRAFEKALIADFKYGKGVLVRADFNHQLMAYLVGVKRTYEFDTAELVIIQPRISGEDKISRWDCQPEYLETFETELPRHIALTKEKEAMLASGEWCRFCRAKATCPALRGELSQALTPITNRELVFPDVKALSIDTVVKILDYRDRIEAWLDAVSMHAFGILESGNVVPGYELDKKRAHRRWKDEEEVLKKFAELGDKLFKVKPISPAQLEKLLGKDRKAEISELTEVPDIGYTIKKSGAKK
jgi:hypothetical protein